MHELPWVYCELGIIKLQQVFFSLFCLITAFCLKPLFSHSGFIGVIL